MSEAERYLDMSETALEDFEKGKEADQSLRALYNRLYYACFYSAKAVLISKNIETKSHSGIANRVFTEIYKQEGLIDRKTAASLSKIQTKRDQSDYELEINDTEEDLADIEEDAKKFIERMKEIAVGEK